MPGPGRPAKGRPPKSPKGKAPAQPPRAGDAARKIGKLARAVGAGVSAKAEDGIKTIGLKSCTMFAARKAEQSSLTKRLDGSLFAYKLLPLACLPRCFDTGHEYLYELSSSRATEIM